MQTVTRYKYRIENDLMNRLLSGSHVLISGTTGSGKSVLIDGMIYALLCNSTPKTHRIVLLDPKKVSLRKYEQTPFCEIYADDNEKIINALDLCINTMMSRYEEMQKEKSVMYNGPYIYIFIDELADLMTTCKKEVMPRLQRLLQLGRAARVAVVAATQEPNRIVIPSLLTVNFTCRVGLRCNDAIESKQVIKRKGCEALPQYGECILLDKDGKYYHSKIHLINDADINDVIEHWQNQNIAKRRPRKLKNTFELKVAVLSLCGSAFTTYLILKFLLFFFSAYS